MRTYNGSFSSTLNVSGPPRGEANRGRRVTYTLGNGSADMDMETFGGSIPRHPLWLSAFTARSR